MVELKNLTLGYADHLVLSQVSLALEPGRVLALIGPNGCGKSTLLKAACGLLTPQAGEVLLDGKPLADYPRKEVAQRISYLSQERTVPDISVRRMVLHGRFPHLSYPRRYGAQDYALVDKALETMDMADYAHRSMSQLSGGQRQRVYLAMTLAQQGQTVLLDEPTTYLDVGHQLEVLRLTHRLASEGKAVVLVLHDLTQALAWADDVAVHSGGQLQQVGTPEAVFQSGVVEQVFGITLRRFQTQRGWRYYCEE
jgi:iron complex transport system ATP-binding protein